MRITSMNVQLQERIFPTLISLTAKKVHEGVLALDEVPETIREAVEQHVEELKVKD